MPEPRPPILAESIRIDHHIFLHFDAPGARLARKLRRYFQPLLALCGTRCNHIIIAMKRPFLLAIFLTIFTSGSEGQTNVPDVGIRSPASECGRFTTK